MPWAISNLSVKFVFSNIFDINPGTTIYFEDVIIIIQKPLSKRQGPLRASVVETHVKRYLKWNLKPWQPCDSSVMLQLVFLLITFTLLPTKNLAQEAQCLLSLCISGWSIFHVWILWFLPSVKEKLILTVLNLLIQAICQKPSLHMVPYHLIFTGAAFQNIILKAMFAPELICGILCSLLHTVFKYRRLWNHMLISQKYTDC